MKPLSIALNQVVLIIYANNGKINMKGINSNMIEKYENIRKKHFPKYMTFLLTAMTLGIITVIFLIILDFMFEWWLFLILALSAIILVSLFIYLADKVEKKFIKTYNDEFQNEVINPIISNTFKDLINDKKEELNLSNIPLIEKSHKYKVLNQIHTLDYSLYEITMLNDIRFHGFIIKKEINGHYEPFMMTNYNYYFKLKIKDHKIKTGIPAFDNRFILYSKNSNFKMDEKLTNTLTKRLSNVNQIGVMLNNNTVYYVLALKSTFGNDVSLNIPLITEINNEYLKKVKEFMQTLNNICDIQL